MSNLGFGNFDQFENVFNFEHSKVYEFHGRNLANSFLSGNLYGSNMLRGKNIISSVASELTVRSSSFNNSDIKDSRFKNSLFLDCNFNDAAHNNNLIDGSEFTRCSFSQTSITISEFSNCTFHLCDFTNVIISDCRFTNCLFKECSTSNKMIESSLILGCLFQNMTLEISTITENYGLSKVGNSTCRIVENAKKPDNEVDITNLSQHETNGLIKFKLDFFVNPEMTLEINTSLDDVFKVENWLRLSQNPNRFKLHIEKLHEFLLNRFENDSLRLRSLIQLFETTSSLSEVLSRQENLLEIQRSVDGVFINLERLLEKHLESAKILTEFIDQEGECRLLVIGPMNKEYYYDNLDDLLKIAPVQFGKVIKHNSPNELFLHWESIKHLWPIILFLYTSKFKFELVKLDKVSRKLRSKRTNIARDNQLIKFESGILSNSNTFSFKLKTLLPGHHELSLLMELHPERYKKLVSIVKDIIIFRKEENGEDRTD